VIGDEPRNTRKDQDLLGSPSKTGVIALMMVIVDLDCKGTGDAVRRSNRQIPGTACDAAILSYHHPLLYVGDRRKPPLGDG